MMKDMKAMLRGGLERMLMCDMPEAMRVSVNELLSNENASEYELKSAYDNYSRRLVLARPREQIDWNPTVDADKCTGCNTCIGFCPHGVYVESDGIAEVAHPTECVILCSNCMPLCPAGAISFPQQKRYAELLKYE